MENTFDAQAIAHEIKAAQDGVRQITPITSRFSGVDHAAGYDVARLIHEARVGEGASAVGRKIGFTNPALWPVYGVHEPIWAYVYDTTVIHLADSRGECHIGRLVDPKIEPEIIFHFRSAPPMTDDHAEILACVDWIAHGFEIVQCHFPGWKFAAPDAIADSGLHGTLLVGTPQNVEQLGSDLITVLQNFTVRLSCDGNLRETGKGSNVLGSPLLAVAHLIATMAKQLPAVPIQANELVTTGSLTAALPIQAGETWSTELEGIALPGLSVQFVS